MHPLKESIRFCLRHKVIWSEKMNEYIKKSTGIILESGFSREKEEKQSEEAAFQAKGPAFANAWRKMRAWGDR